MARRRVRRPRVDVDARFEMLPHAHGHAPKDLFVCHETVSPDRPGLADVRSIEDYLARIDYGMHLVVDRDGNSGWSDDPTAIYWHAASAGSRGNGWVNTRGIGCEQISIPHTNPTYYWHRLKQLHKVARWIAFLNKWGPAHGIHIPIVYDPRCRAGVTTHFDVTACYGVPGGHTDCNPSRYPVRFVVRLARWYRRVGWF